MGTRHGYEYRYEFRENKDLTPAEIRYIHKFGKTKLFFFEIRTSFTLKRGPDSDEEDALGSERFDMSLEEEYPEDILQLMLSPRLDAYWMLTEESLLLASRALDFGRRLEANSPHMCVIPVVVDLVVCTVKLERETIDEARARAIREECLPPIYLWPDHSRRIDKLSLAIDFDLRDFLRVLGKTRVRDVHQGLSLMEMCPICLHRTTVAAQVSLLPCGHPFHYHCIVLWLMKSNLCPSCSFPAHHFPTNKC
ncbi:hypothetical protein ACP275_03G062100 [Erythranthe tilingii]